MNLVLSRIVDTSGTTIMLGTLKKDGLIRARVFLLDHVKSATVQLSRCWATPFADPKVEPFDLIDNL